MYGILIKTIFLFCKPLNPYAMTEEAQFVLDSTEENMQNALMHLEKEFNKIRAGKASPAMLGGVLVEYYGTTVPIEQTSNINTPILGKSLFNLLTKAVSMPSKRLFWQPIWDLIHKMKVN